MENRTTKSFKLNRLDEVVDGRVFVKDDGLCTYSDSQPFDENAWMLDDASSFEEDEDKDGKMLFGLNQSWPKVSNSSHRGGCMVHKKLQRQISQESLDESTNLLLDHIVMLDLPEHPEEESNVPLCAHALMEEEEVGNCYQGNSDHRKDASAPSQSATIGYISKDADALPKNQDRISETLTYAEERDREGNTDEPKLISSTSETLKCTENEKEDQQINEEMRITPLEFDRVLTLKDDCMSAALFQPVLQEVGLDAQNNSGGSYTESDKILTDAVAGLSPGNKVDPLQETLLLNDPKLFIKQCSPTRKKKPPLLRHISQESIEESTNLLLDHVVVMDLHSQQEADGGVNNKPFLVDVEENPLLENNPALDVAEDEDKFVYKGEDNSCNDDDDEEDDEEEDEVLKEETDENYSNKVTVTSSTNGSSDNHQNNEFQDVKLIRVESDHQILSFQNLNDGDSCWFNRLPDEIIIHIFKYFTTSELCNSIVLVCKQWHYLALDPSLWQHLDFSTKSNIPPEVLKSILDRCTLLKSISFRGRDELTISEVQLVADHCSALQEIHLGFVDNINDVMLRTLISGCQMMSSINVEGCSLITDSLVSRMIKLPRLRALNLSHCTKLTDEAVFEVARMCHHLEELNIDGIPWITDAAVLLLTEERRNTLRFLKIDGAELNDISIQRIVQCPNIEEINISFCEQLTDCTLDKLKDWNKPRRLRLQKGKEFSDVALSDFFLCRHLSSLTFLDMSECSELRDQALINITSQCRLLRYLAVEWCWFITDLGLVHIIENCRHLRHLDLLGLHEILGGCLEDIPTKLPRLEYLDLRQCNRITDAMLVQIVSIKRDLIIVNYYGEDVTYDSTLVL